MDVARLVLRVKEVGPPEELSQGEEDAIAQAFEAAEEAAKKVLSGMRIEIEADYE